jgi:capsular polysaccharide biosynthesis protein
MQAEMESLSRQIVFKEADERRLSSVIKDYQSRIEAVPGVESEWLSLSRDYDTVQQSFKALLLKTESAKAAVDLENRQVGEQFRVLDPPRVPGRPISPLRPRISAAGFAIGLVAGLGFVVLLELRDTSFRNAGDVEQVLSLPVIALLPLVLSAAERRRVRNRRLLTVGAALISCGAGGYVFWAMRLWNFVV